MNIDRLEKAIRTIRRRIWDMTPERQDRATQAIHTLKNRINRQPVTRDYHWMYACE